MSDGITTSDLAAVEGNEQKTTKLDYFNDIENQRELTKEDLETIGTNNFWFYFDEDAFIQKFYNPQAKGFSDVWNVEILKLGEEGLSKIKQLVKHFKSMKSLHYSLMSEKIRADRNGGVFDNEYYEQVGKEKEEAAKLMEDAIRPIFIKVGEYFIDTYTGEELTNKLKNLFN